MLDINTQLGGSLTISSVEELLKLGGNLAINLQVSRQVYGFGVFQLLPPLQLEP